LANLGEGINLQMNILLYSNDDVYSKFVLSLLQKAKQQEVYQLYKALYKKYLKKKTFLAKL